MQQSQSWLRQQEKLAALGKLSAGLAHELNNPAAAAKRAANDLREEALKAGRDALAHDERFSEDQKRQLEALLREATEGAPPVLDTLERGDREDELAGWLEDRDFEDAWELAPALAAAGLDAETLAGFAGGLEDEALAGALEWFGTTLNLATLAGEVGQSVGRISDLVRAMKEYSHMDRESMGEVDVREGLESTLTILGHKLRDGGVTVEREYEEGLPKVRAHGGELNQVWTNIIDNAVDAMDGLHGTLRVKADSVGEDGCVIVEISDDGPGIPEEVRDRIFEPFFTTKGVGEGTGLGLDIVQRILTSHGGSVRVDSAPGETRFRVRLPVSGSTTTASAMDERGKGAANGS